MAEELSLTDKILTETATIPWTDLQTLYAKGVLIWVSASLDLVEVASDFAEDNTSKIEHWLTSGEVQKMTDDKAREWSDSQPEVWASVIAPWVLVQDKTDSDKTTKQIQ